MAKILITGGAGFIGSQLGYKLYNDGHEVILLDNMSFGHKDNLIINGKKFGTFILDDIRNKSLFNHCKGVDYVYHLAGIAPLPNCQENPYNAVDINVAGTANVLEASRVNGVKRVIFASTSAIYENNKQTPFLESDKTSPDLIYATTKMQCEALCNSFTQTYGIETVILRFFNVYGPHQDFQRKQPPLTGYLIKEFILGNTPILHSDGYQKRDYVYIDDLLELCEIVMTHKDASGETFNVSSGKAISVREIVDIISSNFKNAKKPIYREAHKFWDKYPKLFGGKYPLKKQRLEAEVKKFSLGSTNKSKQILNWEAKTNFEEGFKVSVEYAKKIGL
jgi:UDP-glucose 4-epimerase